MQFSNSDELCEYIRAQSETILLSFSRGKDSLAAYVQLRRHGFRIVPVHYYLVPGLSFIRESLDYYERVFGCHIYDLPNPSLYRMLDELIYQPPERCRHIEAAGLVQYTYDQLFAIVKLAVGLPIRTIDSKLTGLCPDFDEPYPS